MVISTLAPVRPPHSEECERAVLAAMLLEPERVAEVAGRLTPEDFYIPRHSIIFRAMLALNDSGSPVNSNAALSSL